MARILLLIASLLLVPLPGLADTIAYIELHNRPAAEIIPVIEPLLDPDASVSGQGFTLIIRASAENLEQLRPLIVKLDQAPQQLLISVFQGSDRELRSLTLDAGITYRAGDLDVRTGTGKPVARGGATVHYDTDRSHVDATTLSTRGRLSDNPVHRLRVTEGTAAYIETGQSIPFFSGSVWQTPRGTAVQGGVDYKDVTTGFYVFPRVNGDRVILEISPFKESLSRSRADTIDTQRAVTTVTGRLGEWLQIGAVSEQVQNSTRGIGHYASTEGKKNTGIWIKADAVK